MEIWKDILKWLTDLAGETKLAFAILFIVIGYLGYLSYNNGTKYDALMDKYTTQVDKNGETTKQLDVACNTRIDSLNAKWERKHESYRNKIDEENKAFVIEIRKKLNEVEKAKDELQTKLQTSQHTANNISNKLNK